MVMRRVEQWPINFSLFLRERRTMPFAWGANDCLMFVADAIKVMTNVDVAAEYRGTYSDEDGAAKILSDNGGIQAFMTARLGVNPITNILKAGRGDAVLMETDTGLMAGIIDDSCARITTPISDQLTLVSFPLQKAIFAWRY